MKKFKKLFTILCLAFLLSACFHKAENNTSVIEIPEETNTGIVGVDETGEKNVYEINMTAKKFEFDPHTIILNKGEKVVLNIVSTDVAHGFSLPAFNINADLPVNETVRVEFTADKAGEFEFKCSVSCGSGHKGMKGKVIVVE
jgi:cytochrome c oxidase subunit 2